MSKFKLGPAKTRGGSDVNIVYINRFMVAELPDGTLRIYRLDGSYADTSVSSHYTLLPNAGPEWRYHSADSKGEVKYCNFPTTEACDCVAKEPYKFRTAIIDGKFVVEVVE